MSEKHRPLDFVRVGTMTPLQLQVLNLDRCPECHSKMLEEKYRSHGMSFSQCCNCLHVWVREDEQAN